MHTCTYCFFSAVPTALKFFLESQPGLLCFDLSNLWNKQTSLRFDLSNVWYKQSLLRFHLSNLWNKQTSLRFDLSNLWNKQSIFPIGGINRIRFNLSKVQNKQGSLHFVLYKFWNKQVRFASISKRKPRSKLRYAFVSILLPLLVQYSLFHMQRFLPYLYYMHAWKVWGLNNMTKLEYMT